MGGRQQATSIKKGTEVRERLGESGNEELFQSDHRVSEAPVVSQA